MEGKVNLSNWMSNLPAESVTNPLINLKIPGSHNSFTYSLDRNGRIANDQPDYIRKLDCPAVRSIVYNWTVCQHKTAAEQLNLGVRYFDLRVSCPDNSDPPEIKIVHGLYGDEICSFLVEILEFLGDNRKEVVLLDFNHFYNFNKETHEKLIEQIISLFDCLICPATDWKTLSLNYLWSNNYQVVVFYQPDCSVIDVPGKFWGPKTILSPWADCDKVEKLINYLECTLASRQSTGPSFFVSQGVLTPKLTDVLFHAAGTLEGLCAPATKELVSWVQTCKSKRLFNVVICDFIELFRFTEIIISINYEK